MTGIRMTKRAVHNASSEWIIQDWRSKIDDGRLSVMEKIIVWPREGGWENGEDKWENARNEINLENIFTNENPLNTLKKGVNKFCYQMWCLKVLKKLVFWLALKSLVWNIPKLCRVLHSFVSPQWSILTSSWCCGASFFTCNFNS